MVEFRETEEFRRGRRAERIVEFLLQSAGHFTIPSYDYAGDDRDKPPRLMGIRKRYAVPDLDVCRTGHRWWAEVKYKDRADFTRVTQRHEHGINKRLHDDYVEVERNSGCPVVLVVFQDDTGEILAISLSKLAKVCRIYDGSKMGRGGMVFWPKDGMKQIGRLVRVGPSSDDAWEVQYFCSPDDPIDFAASRAFAVVDGMRLRFSPQPRPLVSDGAFA